MPISRLRLMLLLAPLAVLSCTSPTCACSPARDHAVVYGTARSGAGLPVPNAVVTLALHQCGSTTPVPFDMGYAPARTDVRGDYELRFYAFSGGAVCARVTASRGTGAGADSVVVDGTPISLRRDRFDPLLHRVDFLFP